MRRITRYKDENFLAYAEYGDESGFPILIQHGLIASIKDHELFEDLITLGTRLICMARPGYGDSTPYEMRNIAEWGEIVSALVGELGLFQFDVLGISSGAPYSYAIGYRLPDKVRNIFILSGTPALYDEKILSFWPYPVKTGTNMAEMKKVAREVFFSNLSAEDLHRNDIKDSMMNDCFGIAQDLRLRGMDWGFRLQEVGENVMMRHSRVDEAVPFETAEMTARLLPKCKLDIRESDVHFSKDVLQGFFSTVMAGYYQK